jgi:predicted secreted hydrolase
MTLTDIEGEKFHYFERINRKGIGNAGADSERLVVWNEDWSLKGKDEKHLIEAVESGMGIKLQLVPMKELVFHGQNGISKNRKCLPLLFLHTDENQWNGIHAREGL